jgi:hypothetical protein
MDLSKFRTEDLEALQSGDLSRVSTEALEMLQGKKPQATFGDALKREVMSSLPVATVRGLKDIVDTGAEFVSRLGGRDEQARVRAMNEAGKAEFAQATEGRIAPQIARIGGNVLGTLPAVSGIGSLVSMAAPRLGAAISSGGMTTGAAPTGALARLGDMGIRVAGGAAGGGVAAGMVNPEDAGTGAAIGAVAPPALVALGRAGQAVGSAVRPNINRPDLARRAIEDYGIPLGPANISGSNATRALRSVLNDAPFVGGIGERQGQAVQAGFNRAVGGTFGAQADSLTPEVLDAAKKRMGGEFDRIWNNNRITVDVDMAQQLAALRDEAAKLPQGEGARLMSWLEDVASKTVEDGAGNFTIPGDVANRLQSKLRQEAAKATGFLKDDLTELRRTLVGAFNRSVAPEDAQALSRNMGQYKAFKTVEPLLQGAEAGVAGRTVGDVPAGLLPQAVRQSYRGGIAGSPFEDLTQIGSQYVADRVARTGGSTRAMIQNSALGGALTLGAYANPLTLAAIPAAAGLQRGLGSNELARLLLALQSSDPAVVRALQSPEVQRLVLRSAPLAGTDR